MYISGLQQCASNKLLNWISFVVNITQIRPRVHHLPCRPNEWGHFRSNLKLMLFQVKGVAAPKNNKLTPSLHFKHRHITLLQGDTLYNIGL